MLTQLLDVFSFLSVLLRGCALALESLILGGAIFAVWILIPLRKKWGSQVDAVVQSSRRLIFWSAVALAVSSSVTSELTPHCWSEPPVWAGLISRVQCSS